MELNFLTGSRSHDWYCSSKLNYPEIESLDDAIAALTQQGFLDVDGDIDQPTLLSIFPLAELRSFMNDNPGLKQLRRDELETVLPERDDAEFFAAL